MSNRGRIIFSLQSAEFKSRQNLGLVGTNLLANRLVSQLRVMLNLLCETENPVSLKSQEINSEFLRNPLSFLCVCVCLLTHSPI